jgi:hypothetical protein
MRRDGRSNGSVARSLPACDDTRSRALVNAVRYHAQCYLCLWQTSASETYGITRACGRVAASLRRVGRKTAAGTYNAMIAATAIANQLPVYTCNPTDFAGIDDLQVVALPAPPVPDAG